MLRSQETTVAFLARRLTMQLAYLRHSSLLFKKIKESIMLARLISMRYCSCFMRLGCGMHAII